MLAQTLQLDLGGMWKGLERARDGKGMEGERKVGEGMDLGRVCVIAFGG